MLCAAQRWGVQALNKLVDRVQGTQRKLAAGAGAQLTGGQGCWYALWACCARAACGGSPQRPLQRMRRAVGPHCGCVKRRGKVSLRCDSSSELAAGIAEPCAMRCLVPCGGRNFFLEVQWSVIESLSVLSFGV